MQPFVPIVQTRARAPFQRRRPAKKVQIVDALVQDIVVFLEKRVAVLLEQLTFQHQQFGKFFASHGDIVVKLPRQQMSVSHSAQKGTTLKMPGDAVSIQHRR